LAEPDSNVAVNVAVRAPVARSTRRVLLSRPVLGAATALSLAALAQLVPGLERLRPLAAPRAAAGPAAPLAAVAAEVGEARIEAETEARPDLAQPEEAKLPRQARGPIAAAAVTLPALDAEKPPLPIEDATGSALDPFYAALDRTRRGEPSAITRILHHGDSLVTSDYVTGTLRRKLQKRFGDAGHGFVLLANPWPAYFHNDVYRFASSGWLVSRVVGPLAPDGLYGLGGVSFRAPPGSRARVGTARQGSFGRAVSRFVLSYLEEPAGGKMRLLLDGKEQAVIDTHAEIKRVATHELRVVDGEHELEVVTIEGSSRAFGVVLERDRPGVVLDAIGIQGARIRFLDKQDDAHWAEQLRWRKPDLVVYQFGANESGDGFAYPMTEYQTTMQEVLRQAKRARPEAACLVIGAMDRTERRAGVLTSMEVIPALVREQRRAAEHVGCGFWDTYRAMGGPGSMGAWVARGLGQADLTHPTGSGADLLASWIERALLDGYAAWQKRQAR
jgi:lysophospholipase L1-like esterase